MVLMLLLRTSRVLLLRKVRFILKGLTIYYNANVMLVNVRNIKAQMFLVGPSSLGILTISSCFIGIIFTLQVIKEFLYLNVSSAIGAILSLAFIRELSPILTAVIVIGRVGSAFTAELATMKITEQIDALHLLRVNPFFYLVLPRLIACSCMLPCLNIIFFLASLCSSLFICSIFYNIHPSVFLNSLFIALSVLDLVKSCLKSLIFGLILSTVSCFCGLTTYGGSQKVGQSTTSSVVISLLIVFIVDCLLTCLLFSQVGSIIKSL